MAHNNTILTVSDLSKKYCTQYKRSLWYGVKDIAKEIMFRETNEKTLREKEFWVLEDIAFSLEKGTSLAIIGANGAGKSTLLKILYGLIKPDIGTVSFQGNMNAVLELSTGLNPTLSGRENILIRSQLMGISKQKLNALFDDIVTFAELDNQAIEMPVQFYSSGMTARLSYAIAAFLNPDILLIDEVLAVGDTTFQKKCLEHMLSFIEKGGTLILVSHSPYHIQSVCQRALYLDKGKMVLMGEMQPVLSQYLSDREKVSLQKNTAEEQQKDNNPIRIKNITLKPLEGEKIHPLCPAQLTVHYHASRTISIRWGFRIQATENTQITSAFTEEEAMIHQGEGTLTCYIETLPLAPRNYQLKVFFVDPKTKWMLGALSDLSTLLDFQVEPFETFSDTKINAQFSDLITLNVRWK